MLKKAALLFSLLFCVITYAQEQPQAQKNLMRFIGNWKSTDVKVEMGGKTYTGVYTFEMSPACLNTSILAYEHFSNKDLGTISGINICGYDPNLKQIHLYSLDNNGTSHDHAGYWINDKHLFVEFQGVQDGKIYLEQINMVFNSPEEWTLNVVGMQNGKVSQKVSGTFKKQK